MIRAVQIFNIYPSTAMIACLIIKNSAMPPGNAWLIGKAQIDILILHPSNNHIRRDHPLKSAFWMINIDQDDSH